MERCNVVFWFIIVVFIIYYQLLLVVFFYFKVLEGRLLKGSDYIYCCLFKLNNFCIILLWD